MKKIISFTFLSLCISIQSITMDRVTSNQKARNDEQSRTTASPKNTKEKHLQRKDEKKREALKLSKERLLKHSGDRYDK